MTFFDTLVRYETRLWNHVDDALAAGGAVTLAQLETLRVVDRHADRARVQEIATDLVITPGAASKIADRLESANLIARRPNPDDRRSALVELTETGRERLTAAEAISDAAISRHLSGSGVDVEALMASLVRLDARFSTESAVSA